MQAEEQTCDHFPNKVVNNTVENIPKDEDICPITQQSLNKVIEIKKSVCEEKHICPTVQQSIDKIIETENYLDYEILTKPKLFDGGNYLGDLMEITIKGHTKDGRKENHIFVKHIISNDAAVLDLVHADQAYINEVFMYTDLHAIYDELYNEVNFPDSDRLRRVKCYDSNIHVIVMENLSRKGFKVLNRMDTASLKFAEGAIEQMAKYHALSFILEHKRPEFFDKKIKTLKPIYTFKDGDCLSDTWINLITSMIEHSFKYLHNDQKHKKDAFIERALSKIPKYMIGKIGFVKCLCHGDFRINNILLKENNDEETEVVVIDYQLLCYNSPVIDFLYFVFTGTDGPFRQLHLEHLKDLYHNTMTKHLKLFKLDISKIFSRNMFDKEFQECLDYGLLTAAYGLPVILTDEPDMFRNVDVANMEINKIFADRINEIFQDYMEWGLV